jgi:hypothetical protein
MPRAACTYMQNASMRYTNSSNGTKDRALHTKVSFVQLARLNDLSQSCKEDKMGKKRCEIDSS